MSEWVGTVDTFSGVTIYPVPDSPPQGSSTYIQINKSRHVLGTVITQSQHTTVNVVETMVGQGGTDIPWLMQLLPHPTYPIHPVNREECIEECNQLQTFGPQELYNIILHTFWHCHVCA